MNSGGSMAIELFRCEPLRARISDRQCAANYRAANGFLVRGSESREIGLGPCKGCDTGRKNSGGWVDPRKVKKIKGPRAERFEAGKRLILTREYPITTVARMTGIGRESYRYWMLTEGLDPREWPHSQTHAIPQLQAIKLTRKQMDKTDKAPRPLMARRRRSDSGPHTPSHRRFTLG